ncbi:hypothetical protein [Bdellovibrio reynosensis]|uniref:Peptidase M48 domain-containing protein n=1 Tax=Bdellovibrio reynosensis TaxID=2835041 RepID=A0ABY4C4R1_9BACT|nr:hypothetical protein [Bdellovibrio reynosensis]UOE99931.1 hypothetical protein MNR06_09495 [Bdellovibrio reynosensis]
MKYLLLSFFIFGFSSAAFAYSCKIDQIKQNNPKFCDDLREETPMTDASMGELFNEVQDSMKEFILKGRTVDQLSPEEKSIYARISTVKFSKFTNCGTDPQGKPSVSASYSTTDHSVTFCEGLKDYPLPALVTMIGHEIGHSADSCAVQCYHLHAQDRTRLRLPQDFLNSPDNDPALQTELRSSREPVSMTARLLMSRPDIVEGWRSQPGVTINEPMPLNRYPLNRVRRCLIDQDKVWEAPSNEASHQIAQHRDKDPGCNSHSDYESMADVWGAYSLGKYFEKHPEKRGAVALGMFESRKKELCSPKGYPSTVARLESIWLAVPSVAQALGCESVPERSCMSHIPFPAPTIAPTSNPRISSPGRGVAPGARDGGASRRGPGVR